jgi:hypothetical protein
VTADGSTRHTVAGKVKVIVVELLTLIFIESSVAFTAVTISGSIPETVEVQVRVDVPLVVIVDTLNEQLASPVTLRPIEPVKPPRPATVTVELPPGDPIWAVTAVGLAVKLSP